MISTASGWNGVHAREKIDELIRIEPRWDLGAIFDFDQNAFARNRTLGYYDTLKAFGRMEGFAYSFRPGELARNAERLSFGTAELQKHLVRIGAETDRTDTLAACTG